MISALIPARSGSKGVPKKNIREFRGKPLIRHTIDAAIASGVFNEIVVSSDSEEILSYAGDVTAHLRPTHLAQDDTPMDAVVGEYIDVFDADMVMLLQPTSPLRTAGDIEQAIKFFTYGNVLISVNRVDSTYLKSYVQDGHYIRPIHSGSDRRQDLPPLYKPNGAIYLFNKHAFLSAGGIPKTGIVPFLMHTSLDIDTEDDFR